VRTWASKPFTSGFATTSGNRPVYAAVVLDAINVKVRDGQVANRPVYAAIGVDLEGHKDILGMWFGDGGGESAKFWMAALTELRNRGVADVFFLVCDGLKGLPDSVNAVWPATIVQTCLIHLIRNSFRFASRKYWDELSRDLKPIYTAVHAQAAAATLDDLHAKWGARYSRRRSDVHRPGLQQPEGVMVSHNLTSVPPVSICAPAPVTLLSGTT
jgi:transposase-like protein